MVVIIRSVHLFNMEIPFWYWEVLMDTLIDLFSQSNRISFECCFPSAFQLTGYILVSCICFVHGRNDWNAEEDQHESGSADYAGVVPRRVRLLSSFLDPAWGVPAVFHAGIVTQLHNNNVMILDVCWSRKMSRHWTVKLNVALTIQQKNMFF